MCKEYVQKIAKKVPQQILYMILKTIKCFTLWHSNAFIKLRKKKLFLSLVTSRVKTLNSCNLSCHSHNLSLQNIKTSSSSTSQLSSMFYTM
jgi:hypothetical protein